MSKKCLFICTSQADRSPALEKHFKELYPNHQFKSAGVNQYHTKKKGTHFLEQKDINWASILVYAEDIHQLIAHRHYNIEKKQEIALNAGELDHQYPDSYLQRAEEILIPILGTPSKKQQENEKEITNTAK